MIFDIRKVCWIDPSLKGETDVGKGNGWNQKSLKQDAIERESLIDISIGEESWTVL